MSDATGLTVPAAGWYPDRNEANVIRWWDGQQWTDHTTSTTPEASVEQPVSAAAFGFVAPVAPIAPVATPEVVAPVAPVFLAATPVAAAPRSVAPSPEPVVPAISPAIPPGWYPDNADPSLQRWWDGQKWTAHTAAQTSAAPVDLPRPAPDSYLGGYATPMAPMAHVIPVVNGMATRGMAYSLVSIVLNPLGAVSIAGIIFSIIGLRRAKNFPQQTARRGHAIAGIVVGIAAILLLIFWVFAAITVAEQRQNLATQQQQSAPQQIVPPQSDDASTKTLPQVEDSIGAHLATRFGVPSAQITCPADTEVTDGAIFSCPFALSDGRTGVVQIDTESNGFGWSVTTSPGGYDAAQGTDGSGGSNGSDPDLSNS